MSKKLTYYVDETGDTVFFGKRGKPIKFEEGHASRFFILGAL
jgi:hypothetical protein